jgi:MOSC domain-containing protein YiiM
VADGTLVAIYVTDKSGGAMASVPRVKAIAGRGLEGDRNLIPAGPPPADWKPEYQVTLIEEEAVAAVGREGQPPVAPTDTRRNLLTRGVALNHLVGREFTVGPVRMRGVRLCEPCGYLEGLTRPGMQKDLLHRAGLRATILNDGVLEAGQPVRA